MPDPIVTILVPVCDGERSLERLAALVARAMSETALPYELVFVNDASEDGSWGVIERLHLSDARIRGIDLERRVGQHTALLCGMRAATGDLIVTLDDDLEHPPSSVPQLVEVLAGEVDLVYGTPRERHGPRWRSAGALVARLLLARTAGLSVALRSSPFRAFRAELRDAIPERVGADLCLDVYLNAAARRVVAVRVDYGTSHRAASRYGVRRLARLAWAAGRGARAAATAEPYCVRRVL